MVSVQSYPVASLITVFTVKKGKSGLRHICKLKHSPMGTLLSAACSVLTVGDNSNQPVRCCEAESTYSGMSLCK